MIHNVKTFFEFTVWWEVYMDIMKSKDHILSYIRSIYSEKNYDNMFIISVNDIVGNI